MFVGTKGRSTRHGYSSTRSCELDIFKYLQEDGESIAHRLNETVAEFGQWPQERLFEETKKAFSSLEGHFDKERMIVKNIENSDVVVPLSVQAEAQIKAMKDSIDSTVMIHIEQMVLS